MIRKFLNRILAPRHPWRTVSFSELSEIYLASFLRTLAIGMIGIFVPIYLYKNGYSVTSIFMFYALFYGFGIVLDFLVSRVVALFGPKHVMRVSFLAQIMFSVMLIHIDKIPYFIPLLALIGSLGSTLYFIPYNVDFSKVKHHKHGGKEVGFLQVMEKTAAIAGPIVGGLLATFVSPVATFAASALAMFIAAVVLMLSPEPVVTKQKLVFKGLKVRKHWRDYAAFSFFVGENAISILVWPIFLSLVVFSNNVYLKLGFITSISVLVAIAVALPLGKLIDNKKGHAMIKYGTFVNAIVSLMRIGVNGLLGCVFVAAINEPNTLVYRMAFLKGYYDKADYYPGYRIAYIAANEMIADCLRSTTFLTFAVASLYFSPYIVCSAAFVLAAIYSFGIRLERFPALKK